MKKILETEINKDTNTKFYETETRLWPTTPSTVKLPLRENKMIYTIVSVKDRALNAYGRPIFVHTQGQAIRSFQDEINRSDQQNDMNKHPEDYDLYFLGTFDDNTGTFSQHTPAEPKQIAIGKQLKIQKD